MAASRCPRLLFANHVEERGADFFRAVCERDCIITRHKLGTDTTTGPAMWFKV